MSLVSLVVALITHLSMRHHAAMVCHGHPGVHQLLVVVNLAAALAVGRHHQLHAVATTTLTTTSGTARLWIRPADRTDLAVRSVKN
jgi:hypothetical protein